MTPSDIDLATGSPSGGGRSEAEAGGGSPAAPANHDERRTAVFPQVALPSSAKPAEGGGFDETNIAVTILCLKRAYIGANRVPDIVKLAYPNINEGWRRLAIQHLEKKEAEKFRARTIHIG